MTDKRQPMQNVFAVLIIVYIAWEICSRWMDEQDRREAIERVREWLGLSVE